jgi:hypothetical protein
MPRSAPSEAGLTPPEKGKSTKRIHAAPGCRAAEPAPGKRHRDGAIPDCPTPPPNLSFVQFSQSSSRPEGA